MISSCPLSPGLSLRERSGEKSASGSGVTVDSWERRPGTGGRPSPARPGPASGRGPASAGRVLKMDRRAAAGAGPRVRRPDMHRPTASPVTPLSGHTPLFLTSDFREVYVEYVEYGRSGRPTGLARTGRLERSARTACERRRILGPDPGSTDDPESRGRTDVVGHRSGTGPTVPLETGADSGEMNGPGRSAIGRRDRSWATSRQIPPIR